MAAFALKRSIVWVRFHKLPNRSEWLVTSGKGGLTAGCAFLVPLWCLPNSGCVILTTWMGSKRPDDPSCCQERDVTKSGRQWLFLLLTPKQEREDHLWKAELCQQQCSLNTVLCDGSMISVCSKSARRHLSVLT